ncbi:MAG TPA: PmoA family protein [Chitinophagaceae bacterium]|nr:PmoA family protein [Chitinophagaceae bacterium]
MANSTKIIITLMACTLMNFPRSAAQAIAKFEISITQEKVGLAIPVHVSLHNITFLPDSLLQLVELKGSSSKPVAFQIDQRAGRSLHWIADGRLAGKKTYELRKAKAGVFKAAIDFAKTDATLTLSNNGKDLLRFVHGIVNPPAGVDTAYRKSGFIHPLFTPKGQELTRTQPSDHYHHFGLWNAWTRLLYQNDTFDLWNLAEKQGTVRFAKFLSIINGPVYGEYEALLEHVVFPKNRNESVVINEVQTIRVYPPAGEQNYYIVDMSMRMNCATQSPVKLLQYRYAGLGIRATGEWNRNNSTVMTSDGKNRRQADSSNAKWCMVQGSLGADHGGFVMMSHPTNYAHPEPLRVWPESMYDRGDVFVNFSPTKMQDWLLEPEKTYVLNYRFLVFNDVLKSTQAELAWQNYAYRPEVIIRKGK